VENNKKWHAPIRPSDFFALSRVRLLEDWQGGKMGTYAYFIWPVVSFMPWFRRFDSDRVIISMINRIMANFSCLRSHLGRISIVENPMCVCSRDYETVDHVLWGCERFDAKRPQLWMALRLTDTEWGTLIRDIVGGRDGRNHNRFCSLYRRCNVQPKDIYN
jgi:hypothetical protein